MGDCDWLAGWLLLTRARRTHDARKMLFCLLACERPIYYCKGRTGGTPSDSKFQATLVFSCSCAPPFFCHFRPSRPISLAIKGEVFKGYSYPLCQGVHPFNTGPLLITPCGEICLLIWAEYFDYIPRVMPESFSARMRPNTPPPPVITATLPSTL